MKKWLLAVVAGLLVLSFVAACGSTGLKVGMVSDVGGVDDASFNQNTWDGLVRAQEELVASRRSSSRARPRRTMRRTSPSLGSRSTT